MYYVLTPASLITGALELVAWVGHRAAASHHAKLTSATVNTPGAAARVAGLAVGLLVGLVVGLAEGLVVGLAEVRAAAAGLAVGGGRRTR